MTVSEIDIKTLIPHREPFIMVDQLIEMNETSFVSTFKVCDDNLFVKEQKLHEPAIIENIAQTCAAGLTLLNKEQNNAKKGFLGSINKMNAFKLPFVNDVVTTKIKVDYFFENIVMITGKSYVNEDLLLECEMKIVIID